MSPLGIFTYPVPPHRTEENAVFRSGDLDSTRVIRPMLNEHTHIPDDPGVRVHKRSHDDSKTIPLSCDYIHE